MGLTLAAMVLASTAHAIPLRPSMPALDRPGVPLLWATVPDADRVEPNASLQPETPYRWVIDPGQPFVAQVKLADGARGERAVLTVWDWNRNPVAQQQFSKPCDERVAFEVEGRGTYLLTLDLFAGEECVSRLVRSFSVCPSNLARREAWRTDEFWVGTCAFPGRQHWSNDFGPANAPGLTEQESRDLDAELAARAGLQIVRPDVPIEWRSEQAPIDFMRADASFGAWTSRGFRLGLQVNQPPDWAILPQYAGVTDPKWRYPRREGPCRRWLAEVLPRYAKDAAYLELYNEPDNRDFWRGTPEEYIQWAGWAIEEIKKAAPDVPIAAGGYCLLEPEWTGLFARALLGKLDLIGYHSHGDVTALEANSRAMRATHAAAGYGKPVFINTEMGYAAWRLDMERHQAATAMQKLLYCWAHGNRGGLLYCSRDVGGPRLRTDPDWGFVDHFFCPRFAYGALSAFVDTYAGASFSSLLTEAHPFTAYEFRSADVRIVTAFTTYDGERAVVVTSDATQAEIVDPMGNRTQAPTPTRVELTAGFYPATAILYGATTASVE
jgi:hypothetical protein